MFYTYAGQIGSKILHRWIDDDGNAQSALENFCPTLYTLSNKPDAAFRGIRAEPLEPVHFDSIWDGKQFIKRYKDVENFPIYGNQNWWAQFLNEDYNGVIKWNMKHIVVANIDIEVLMDKGFPEPSRADSEITCISIAVMGKQGKVITFTTKEYEGDDELAKVLTFVDEKEMLVQFLLFWGTLEPNIVTGWNVDGFDIPYLVNRVWKLLGSDAAARLAPTARKHTKKCINEREFMGTVEYTLNGIVTLDYLRIYKKFRLKNRESYKLDYIAHVELKERKLDYSEYGNLDVLWEKNPTKYIDYNIHDVRLIERLDQKLKFLMLICTLAYKCHIRYDDVFFQVRMWDALIYNRLIDKNVVIPPKQTHTKDEKYEGAYVKEPIVGMHEWVISFDLNSLYPSLIRNYWISPESIISKNDLINMLE